MSQEVALVIEKSVDLFKGMPDVLRANETKVLKAEEVGQRIKEAIAAAGGVITPELDERMQKYIVNCNSAKKGMMDGRAPFTQIMTEMARMFTTLEARIDNTKAGTLPFEFQGYRNTYTTQLAKEQQERERLAREAAEKATEAIQLKARVHDQLSSYFNAHVLEKKSNMLAAFNGTTLETIDALSERLNKHDPVYALEHFNKFQHNITGRHHNAVHVTEMVDNVAMFADFEEQYKKELGEQCQDLISKLPSKRQELQEAENARLEAERLEEEKRVRDAELKASLDTKRNLQLQKEQEEANLKAAELKEQQDRAAADKAKREEEEAAELKRKSEEKEETDKANNQLNAQAETVNVLFQSESELQLSADAPESRAGYDIEIVSTAGWMLIFSFWFDKEGKSLPVAKVEKTTMLQMKTYCEKYAHKHGEKIESKFLEYKIVHKAVNRQAK